MTIWRKEPKKRVALLVLATVLSGLVVGLAAWQGSSAGSATVSAANNSEDLLPVAADAAEAGMDDIRATSAISPEGEGSATHSEEPRSAATEANTIAYTYDDAGRLLRVDYGNGTAITYTYDDAGNLLQREVVRAFVEFLPNVQR